jgi:DNA-binding transcriptional LysR family regulator
VVAPDLRAVLRAVELGLGVSLLPEFVCRDALREARVREVFPVSHLTPEEPWFACTRQNDTSRRFVRVFLAALQAPQHA